VLNYSSDIDYKFKSYFYLTKLVRHVKLSEIFITQLKLISHQELGILANNIHTSATYIIPTSILLIVDFKLAENHLDIFQISFFLYTYVRLKNPTAVNISSTNTFVVKPSITTSKHYETSRVVSSRLP